MTTTLTTSKGTFLFVGVPEGSNEHEFLFSVNAPIGSIVVGKLSTLTEDQAREVVRCRLENESYIDSLKRRMKEGGLYTTNMLGKTEPVWGDYDIDGDIFLQEQKQWQASQSRTFPDWLIIKVK